MEASAQGHGLAVVEECMAMPQRATLVGEVKEFGRLLTQWREVKVALGTTLAVAESQSKSMGVCIKRSVI